MARDGFRSARSDPRPAVEPLEGRRLLSTAVRVTAQTVSFDHATYRVNLSGPGQVAVRRAGKGQFGIDLTGSTASTSVTIRQVGVSSNYGGSLLPVARISASTGAIGQILGSGAVDLLGTIATSSPVGAIQLGAVGPSAKIVANGGLFALSVSGAIDLGPKGRISVAGDLAGTLQAGSIDLAGGQITIGQDLGDLSVGSLAITSGGRFLVGHDAGPIQVSQDASVASGSFTVGEDAQNLNFGHDLSVGPGGRLAVGRDLTGKVTLNGVLSIDGGQVFVGRDFVGSASIVGDFTATAGGNLTVGRDLTGSLSVGGDLALSGGGAIAIGRTLGAQSGGSQGLTVGGNLTTGVGAQVRVGGDLDGLQVGGTVVGQASDAVDLSVGLDLNNWSVFGGAANVGAVSGFNVDVGKAISGINILHGLFNDFITAGVLITNANVGADGPVAVFDTEIRSGVQITDVTLSGDVRSDRPVNPAGRRTRIVAGEDRQGDFELGGNLDNFVITGSLIDAVVAASVQPYGGDGSLTIVPAPAPAPGALDYYDAPGGNPFPRFADLGLFYTAPPFDTAIDPTVHDTVLPGEINRSFAPSSASAPYPTKSTVFGGANTTAHANDSDYAGFFAAATSAVFVGTIPTTS